MVLYVHLSMQIQKKVFLDLKNDRERECAYKKDCARPSPEK